MTFLEAMQKLIEEKIPLATTDSVGYFYGGVGNLVVNYGEITYEIFDDHIATWEPLLSCCINNFDIADPLFDPQMIITIIMNGGYK